MKKIIVIALTLIVLCCAFACGTTDDGGNGYSTKKEIPDYEEFIGTRLMKLGSFRPPEVMDATQIGYYKDAGLNFMIMDGSYGNIAHTAEYAQILSDINNEGIEGIVFTNNNSSVNLGTDFRDKPGFGGIMYADEPSADQFSSIADRILDFEDKYPENMFLINLFPSYATNAQMGIPSNKNFEHYIELFCTSVLNRFTVADKWLSIDTYPLINTNGSYSLKRNFLYDLGVVSKYAKLYDLKSHICLQTINYKPSNNRPITEADVKLQVYSCLAFGIQSLSAFTYASPAFSTEFDENSLGMIDREGNRTPTYYAVQSTLGELHSFEHVYLSFDWQGIYPLLKTTTDRNAFNDLKAIESNTILSDISDFNSIKSFDADNNVLLGYFLDDDDFEGFMLVNYGETTKKVKAKADFQFNCNRLLMYRNGVESTVELADKKYSITLDPGEGVFFIPYQINE